MGYQAIELKSTVSDIRSVELGVERAHAGLRNYGADLKAGRFKDAFHKHNTGQPYPADGKPKTYDPKYVERGLHFMEVFSQEDYRFLSLFLNRCRMRNTPVSGNVISIGCFGEIVLIRVGSLGVSRFSHGFLVSHCSGQIRPEREEDEGLRVHLSSRG